MGTSPPRILSKLRPQRDSVGEGFCRKNRKESQKEGRGWRGCFSALSAPRREKGFLLVGVVVRMNRAQRRGGAELWTWAVPLWLFVGAPFSSSCGFCGRNAIRCVRVFAARIARRRKKEGRGWRGYFSARSAPRREKGFLLVGVVVRMNRAQGRGGAELWTWAMPLWLFVGVPFFVFLRFLRPQRDSVGEGFCRKNRKESQKEAKGWGGVHSTFTAWVGRR